MIFKYVLHVNNFNATTILQYKLIQPSESVSTINYDLQSTELNFSYSQSGGNFSPTKNNLSNKIQIIELNENKIITKQLVYNIYNYNDFFKINL